MGKDYIDLPFPWQSKSKLNEDSYCEWQYYDHYIMKNPQHKGRDAIEGTNMHMVLSNFFNYLNEEDIEPFYNVDLTIGIRTHPLRRFIYERCMEYVKPSERGHPFYKNVINNFATAETERFIELRSRVSSKKEILQYYKPLLTEQRWEIDLIKWHGTLDRVDIVVAPNGTKKIMIVDYKTGRVPSSILKGPRNPIDQFSWELSTEKMKELHFYGIMYLLRAGWTLSNEVVEFLTDPKWWFYTKDNLSYEESKKVKDDYVKSLNSKKDNRWKIYKENRELKQGDIILCIYYLGGDKPYKVMKEFNYRSYKSVLMQSNDRRSKDYNKKWVDHPKYVFNEFVCSNYKRCQLVEKCKEMVLNE